MKSCEEWMLAFNQFYNNITSSKAPGLEPFEISRILTDAQNAVVVGLHTGTIGNPFESTEQATSYLAPLVRQAECEVAVGDSLPVVSGSSSLYLLPDDVLFLTLEMCYLTDSECGDDNNERQAVVIPVTQDEYWRTVRNPFKRQNANRVLRLSHGSASVSGTSLTVSRYSELISDYAISRYVVRYLSKPEPIVLVDLTDIPGLSIDGCKEQQTCLLPEALHQLILSEAVRMAKAAWNS